MNRFKSFLQQNYSLTDAEWEVISEYGALESLSKNVFFIQENAICRRIGIILSGVMRYFSLDTDGNEPTCYFVAENQMIIDPFGYPEQMPSKISLKSVTDCELFVFSFEQDTALRKKLPRWESIYNAILVAVSIDFANQKSMMVMSAAERYNYFVKNYPTISQRAPLQYIASYLGIAQPSLSRLRKNSDT